LATSAFHDLEPVGPVDGGHFYETRNAIWENSTPWVPGSPRAATGPANVASIPVETFHRFGMWIDEIDALAVMLD